MCARYGWRVELHTTHRGALEVARILPQFALEVLAPTRCAGCDAYGPLLCDRCAADVWRYDSRLACERCGAPFGWLVCTECWDAELPFAFTVTLGSLEGQLARAVVLHKDHNDRRLGPMLGSMLGSALALAHPEWGRGGATVTWIPPSASALRRRDFDHGRSIAVGLGAALGSAPRGLLGHRGARDNRALGRSGRSANVGQAFEAIGRPSGRVILVDDVITTGATAVAAATLLREAGASEVALAAIARAW